MLKKYSGIISMCNAIIICAVVTGGAWIFPSEARAASRIITVNNRADYAAIPSLVTGDTLMINTTQSPEDQKTLEIVGTDVTIIGTGAVVQGLAINVNSIGAKVALDNISFMPLPGKAHIPAVSFAKGGTLELRNDCRINGAEGMEDGTSSSQSYMGGDALVNLEASDLRIIGDGRSVSIIKGGAGAATSAQSSGKNGGIGINNTDGAVTIFHNVEVVGGNGGDNVSGDGSPGGAGIIASALTLNGQVDIGGGNGGNGIRGGDGGNGVTISSNINILSESNLTGGNGGIGSGGGGGKGGTAISCEGDLIATGRLTSAGGEGTGDANGGVGISASSVSLLDVSQITGGTGQTGGSGISVEQRATYTDNSDVSGGGNGGLNIINSKLRNMETYTVTFDAAGGTMPTPTVYRVTATTGSAVFGALPSKITRPGYLFAEWGRMQLGGGNFMSESPITSDMTITARWVVGQDIYDLPENIPIRISDGSSVSLPKPNIDNGFYTVNLNSGGGTAYIPMILLPYAKNLVNIYSSFHVVSDIGSVIVPVDGVLESEEYLSIASSYNVQPGEIDLAVRISGSPVSCEIFIAKADTGEKLGNFKELDYHFIAWETQTSASFSDVPESHWAKEYIDYSAQKSFVSGVGDGKFDPERSVTRAEFVQMTVNAISPEVSAGSTVVGFPDVTTGDWFYSSVNTAKAVGLLDRFDEANFYPNRAITREEMAGILARVLDYRGVPMNRMYIDLDELFKDSFQIDARFQNDVRDVYRTKLMSGTGNNAFDPKGATTRAQAATVLYNVAELLTALAN